ncbi:hypothetical protein MBLNU459_g5661t2 [Dothideomycetes sp. NU459]
MSTPSTSPETAATTADFEPRRRIKCSAGEDEAKVSSQATALTGSGGGRWRLTDDGKGLERGFRFKTFKATWDFMNTVAAECKVQRHHPEWSNVFNKTHIRWTTHRPDGLSAKDVHMARFCDDAGGKHGEVIDPDEEVASCKTGTTPPAAAAIAQ